MQNVALKLSDVTPEGAVELGRVSLKPAADALNRTVVELRQLEADTRLSEAQRREIAVVIRALSGIEGFVEEVCESTPAFGFPKL